MWELYGLWDAQEVVRCNIIQKQRNTANRYRTIGNRKRTRSNKPRKPSRIHLTIHTFVQQEEIQEVTKKTRIGP